MSVDPVIVVYDLMQSDPNIIAAAVIKGKEIIYTTDNWDISGDFPRVGSSWVYTTDNWDISGDVDRVGSIWIGQNVYFYSFSLRIFVIQLII